MTKLSLVRHGQTDWNLAKRIQGSSDIPLNDTGRAQARAVGEAFRRRRWDAIFSSPLGRARETACIIADGLGLAEPGILPGLAERAYGEVEGLTGAQILARFPDGAEVPGRESRDQVADRSLAELRALAEEHRGQSLIVVSHGGVIASLVRYVTHHALPKPGDVIPNGSVHDFVLRDGVLELDRFNLRPEDYDLFTAAVS
ncbi:MAG: histidine phosphatase family protein [Microbacteriaceae bacterium]